MRVLRRCRIWSSPYPSITNANWDPVDIDCNMHWRANAEVHPHPGWLDGPDGHWRWRSLEKSHASNAGTRTEWGVLTEVLVPLGLPGGKAALSSLAASQHMDVKQGKCRHGAIVLLDTRSVIILQRERKAEPSHTSLLFPALLVTLSCSFFLNIDIWKSRARR